MDKNILLLGGAFNPPTIAHANLAVNALELKQIRVLDRCELWFMPSYSSAFNTSMTVSMEHRLNMLDILVNGIIRHPSIRISKYAVEQCNNAGPYSVVRSLIKDYPGVNFTYVIGSDHAQRIRDWRKSRDLVKTIPFIVVNRAGIWNHSGMYWHTESPHVHHKKSLTKDRMSSSQVRSDLGGTVKREFFSTKTHPMLHDSIKQYIYDNDLYRSTG
jgi:nicotinate (nicotinamide) nucleotide adenylyltransferase